MPTSKSDNEIERHWERVPSGQRPSVSNRNTRGDVPTSLPNSPYYHSKSPSSSFSRQSDGQEEGAVPRQGGSETIRQTAYSVKPVLRPRLVGIPYQTEHTYLISKREIQCRTPVRKISKYVMTDVDTKYTADAMTETSSITQIEKILMTDIPETFDKGIGTDEPEMTERAAGVSVMSVQTVCDIATQTEYRTSVPKLVSTEIQLASLDKMTSTHSSEFESISDIEDEASTVGSTKVEINITQKMPCCPEKYKMLEGGEPTKTLICREVVSPSKTSNKTPSSGDQADIQRPVQTTVETNTEPQEGACRNFLCCSCFR